MLIFWQFQMMYAYITVTELLFEEFDTNEFPKQVSEWKNNPYIVVSSNWGFGYAIYRFHKSLLHVDNFK